MKSKHSKQIPENHFSMPGSKLNSMPGIKRPAAVSAAEPTPLISAHSPCGLEVLAVLEKSGRWGLIAAFKMMAGSGLFLGFVHVLICMNI